MSRTIENRIVQMEFQNKQFEDAVEQSRQSIQLLEKDLQLLEGVQALKNLDEAVQSIDVSSISDGIEELNDRFSTLGVISMSITNTLTNAFTGNLLSGIKSVTSAFTGLFSTVYEKGLNRAKSMQQAYFSFQGLLSTVKENGVPLSEKEQQRRIDNIMSYVDKSVTGTPYALNQAANAASILAAAYGTTDKAAERIGQTLNTITGLAAQTGREYEDVSRVISNIAASGVAMNDEIDSIQSWGLGAKTYIAEYINASGQLTKQMNDVLRSKKEKRSDYQTITEQDVKQLASKGAITSDIIMDVFDDFFDNAKKANDTLSGVTANIGSALGRIGANFIEPIIKNEGPLVKFLNVIREKLNEINKALSNLGINENTVKLVTSLLENLSDIIKGIDISKITIFNKLSETIDGLSRAFTINEKHVTYDGTNIERWGDNYKVTLQKVREYYDKYVAPTHTDIAAFAASSGILSRALSESGASALTNETLEKAERLREIVTSLHEKYKDKEYYDELFVYSTNDKGERIKVYIKETMQNYADQLEYLQDWNDHIDEYLEEQAINTSGSNYRLAQSNNDIFSYNYLENIYEGLNNIRLAFSNIGDTIDGVLSSIGGPFKVFYDIITGKSIEESAQNSSKELRMFINDFSETFLTITEKIEDFTKNNEAFRDVIKAIVNIFVFAGDVISAVWTILGNAFTSFAPLFERIWNFIGSIANTLNEILGSSKKAETIGGIVDGISWAIDILAKSLISAWDFVMGFLGAFSPEEINNTIGLFIEYCKIAGEYLYKNIPIWIEKAKPYVEMFIGVLLSLGKYIIENIPGWIEKAKPYLESFGEAILEVGGFISDILGEALDAVSPYIEEFTNWLNEATDGAIDISKPIETVNTLLDENAESLETVNEIAGTVKDTVQTTLDVFGGGGASGSTFLGAPMKVLSSIVDVIDPLKEKKGQLADFADEVSEAGNVMLTPWEKIKALVEITKNFVNERLQNFGILEEGETLGGKISGFFKGIWEKIKNLDFEKILGVVGLIAEAVGNFFIKFSFGQGIINTSSAIKKLPDMFMGISETVRTFSPFYADVMKADNVTTRREAIANILKSLAAVFISIAVAVGVIAYAVTKLSDPSLDLEKGMGAMWKIMLPLLGIIAALMIFMGILIGKDRNTTTADSMPIIAKFKGIKTLITIAKKGGFGQQTRTITSQGANIWKDVAAIAGVIAAFGLAVALISLSIGFLGNIGETELNRGLDAFLEIARMILVLIVFLGAFAAILRGGTNNTSLFGGHVDDKKYGVKTVKNGIKANSVRNNADWKIIAALAVSILIISAAIGGLMTAIAVIANIPMKHLDNAMAIFWGVITAIAELVVIIGLIATLMTAFNKNNKKGIGGSIIAMAVLIGVIGLVIGGLMQIIVEIALLPIEDVTNAVTIFTAVVDAVAMIIAVIGVIIVAISAITSFGTKGDKVAGALLSASLMFAAIGVMFVAIGASFLLIGMGIGAIAVAFKGISENELNSIVLIIGIIGAMVVLIMAAVAVMVGLAKKQNGQGLKELPKIILATATIFVGLGVMFAAIGLMAKLIGESGVDIGQLKNIIITITVLVAAVMVCVAVMVGLSKDAMFLKSLTLVLIATAAIFAGLAIMFFSIGEMAKLIGESGVSLDSLLGIIITITVLVTAVMVCVAVIVALMETGVGEVVLGVILSISALFAALGFLFISIGAMAILIGFGVELFVDALTKFINFFMSLDDGKMDSTMSNLEKFMYGLGTVVFAGLIGIATFLDANRERVVDAIKKIIKFIMEAIFASIEQSWDSSLDTLTHLIESLQVWLNKNKFEIISIIEDIGEILYTVIDTFMDNLVKLILGENYDGGEDGYLGQLTKGLIMWLRTYFLDEGAIGRTLFRDLFKVLGEEAHQGILDFLDLIINSQDIPLKTFEAIDSVICGLGNAIITKGPEIVDHVKELIRVTWALIKYALGISDVPPQSTMFGITGGAEKGDPEGAMDEMADDMMSGLANTNWHDAVKDFLSALWNAMVRFAEGVEEIVPGGGGLIGLGRMLAAKIIAGTHEGGDGGSPWGAMEQEGIWAVEGLYQGLKDRRSNKDLVNASRDLSSRIVKTVDAGLEAVGNPTNNFLSGFSDELTKLKTRLGYLVTPLFDTMEAKISPYLDLTQIEEGFGSIQDMMNGNSEFDISAINADSLSSMTEGMTDSSEATDAAEGFDDVNMPDMGLLNDVQPETILNFTQNNYSPESLARIDIYRDTKNLLNDPSNLRNLIGVGGISSLLNYHEGGGGSRF